MTEDELIDELVQALVAAVDMRTAQTLYFKTRASADLIASKNAERAFDKIVGAAVGHVHRRRRERQDDSRPVADRLNSVERSS